MENLWKSLKDAHSFTDINWNMTNYNIVKIQKIKKLPGGNFRIGCIETPPNSSAMSRNTEALLDVK